MHEKPKDGLETPRKPGVACQLSWTLGGNDLPAERALRHRLRFAADCRFGTIEGEEMWARTTSHASGYESIASSSLLKKYVGQALSRCTSGSTPSDGSEMTDWKVGPTAKLSSSTGC